MGSDDMERLDALFKRLEVAEGQLRDRTLATSSASDQDKSALQALFTRLASSEAASRQLIVASPNGKKPPAAPAAAPKTAVPPPVKSQPAPVPGPAAPPAVVKAKAPAAPPPAVEPKKSTPVSAATPPAPPKPAAPTPQEKPAAPTPVPAAAATAAAAAAAPASTGGPSLSGFLSEKGKNFFKPWQKRYCVIDGATLTVRHKNILGIVCPPSLILQYVFCPAHTLQIFMDDKKEVQMSYINLKDIKLVEVKKNLINISLAVGKKELKTTTDAEAAQWAGALRN
jgi:hypothetical protein